MPRDLYTIKLPEDMTFLLDANDHPMARLKNGRVFPLNHPVIQATLFQEFANQKKRCPTREELRCVTLQATSKAAEQTRTEEDFLEDLQEQETVIPAMHLLLTHRQAGDGLPVKTKLRDLRHDLVEFAMTNGLDISAWPEGKHFGTYILRTLEAFWPKYNVKLTYRRKNWIREYKVDWVIRPPKQRLVTGGDPLQESLASPESEHDERTADDTDVGDAEAGDEDATEEDDESDG